MLYTAWALRGGERERLLALFPPAFSDVMANHVSLQFDVPEGTPPPSRVEASIVGIANNGRDIQALVVEIDGATQRPDGRTFHITWSVDKARGARHTDGNILLISGRYDRIQETRVALVPVVLSSPE